MWRDGTSCRSVNVVMSYTKAYTTYGVKVIVSPDVPNNEGAFRVLRITAPEGRILNARHPALANPQGRADPPPRRPDRDLGAGRRRPRPAP